MRAAASRMKWWLIATFGLLLAVPALASAAEEFDPAEEFEVGSYIPIDLGFIDLSINKAVLYMLVSSAIIILFGVFVVRGGLKMKPNKAQNVLEISYEFAEQQIAGVTLPERVFTKWFPYLATLFLFVAVNNLISFIPLPTAPHTDTFQVVGDLGLYAATANINVTLALALMTFVAFLWEGFGTHGFVGYFKTLIPPGSSKGITPFIFVLELLSQVLRLVSLSVRLFANMLAGHLLIIMAAGFSILVGSLLGVLGIPFAVFFYVFEWVLVAGLQAFIFALLSGIYIGYAAQSEH
ncbi:MAG: F0F1 ATP synthase subunit A [Actinobacteria bacterium]|nr:F0F1 ATP synthase subunit A [Actinomycetota bacterium]MBM3697801.1 F0F1 ATP synthase subunit A [Actinomycetota bacterium]